MTFSSSSSLATHFGMAQGVNILTTPKLWAPGGVFRAQITDSGSPITYGYGEELGVYFNTAPVFQIGGNGHYAFWSRGASNSRLQDDDLGGPGSTTARHTGRGGIDEKDVVQGRPQDMGKAGVEAFRASQEEEEESSNSSASDRIRTIMNYSSDLENLLISGGIRNGESLAGTPALLDVTLGVKVTLDRKF